MSDVSDLELAVTKLNDIGFLLGVPEGVNKAIAFLVEEATRCFLRGEDDEAKALRSTIDGLRELMKTERKKFDQRADEKTELWETVERHYQKERTDER